jgi:hypothetical protein
MRPNISLNKYMNAVNAKLRDPATKKFLTFGKLDPRYAKQPLRSEDGYNSTAGNILQIAQNLWQSCNGYDVVADKIVNFSQMPGYADISKVKTIGAIDITIWNLANSIIPYLAIDRGLATPVDTIYYQNLVARNTAGGVNAGDQIYGNFAPPNTNVDLGLLNTSHTLTGEGADATVTIATNAIPGQVTVKIVDGTDEYIGKDFNPADGVIYFSGLPSTVAARVTIDYATHTITAESLKSGAVLTATWVNDVTKDPSGSDVLKVNAEWENCQLETGPKQVILESNLLNNAWMNKTYKFSGGTSTKTYEDLAFSRITDVYTEAMNIDLLRTMVGSDPAYLEVNKVSIDFSTYDTNKFAQTKNDLMAQFIISMSAKFLSRTNIAPTVIISGTAGVALLSAHPDKWVANPTALKGLNGLAGYFDGTPVLRHNFFDRITPTGQADFYMGMKFPDNTVASLAFGEYLPLTNTGAINNFNNPIHTANGFFSVVGSKLIKKELVQKGTVKLPPVMIIQ